MNDSIDATIDSLLHTAGKVRFKTILADCPWPSAKSKGGSRHHWLKENMKPRYSTLTIRQLYRLPVGEIADKDAMLVMWTTWMHLEKAFEVMRAWGFDYATGMPWLKVCKGTPTVVPIYGPGVWFQHCTEIVLLGRRGRPFGALGNPRPARKGIVISPRQEHSKKPEEVHKWLEAKFPGPMLEMFARESRKGWTVWGNEVQ